MEEKNNVWNTPYKFNGKELDEEAGLSYYSDKIKGIGIHLNRSHNSHIHVGFGNGKK